MSRHRRYLGNRGVDGYAHVRLKAAQKLREWDVVPTVVTPKDGAYSLMSHLLGRAAGDLVKSFTDEDAHTLELLVGPNGYAIYRALLARRGPYPSVVETEDDAAKNRFDDTKPG